MELDLEKEFADRAYQLLVSLVVPRPIAFVTTISADGKVNAAPFSFFNVLGAQPPIVAFAPGVKGNAEGRIKNEETIAVSRCPLCFNSAF